jgi:hypothetical protein
VLPAALVLLIAGLLAVALFLTSLNPFAGAGTAPATPYAGTIIAGGPPTGTPSGPLTISDMALGGLAAGRSAPPPKLLVEDPLARATPWVETSLPRESARCFFENESMVAQKETHGSYRCKAPHQYPNTIGQAVEVDVSLGSTGSCAAIWMRFRLEFGYLVRVCATNVHVGTHRSTIPETYQSLSMAKDPIVIGAPPVRIAVAARGNQLEVSRDGRSLGTVTLTDPDISAGRIVLGIFTESGAPLDPNAPYRVRYSNVRFHSLDG